MIHNRGHLVFNLPMGRHLQPRGECGEIDGMEAIAATDVGQTGEIGFYQSVLCFITILIANWVVKKKDENYSLF